MGKLILWIAIGFGVIMVLRTIAGPRGGKAKNSPTKPQVNTNLLLPCPTCGVHVPESDLAAHRQSHL